MNQLIHCINCHEIYLRTPFDQTPEYEWEPLSSLRESPGIEKDDFQDFLRNHRGHQLEDLKIVEDSFVCEKPYAEPVNISYFKASPGSISLLQEDHSQRHILRILNDTAHLKAKQ